MTMMRSNNAEVVKPKQTNTIRIVCNAAAKYHGRFLNDLNGVLVSWEKSEKYTIATGYVKRTSAASWHCGKDMIASEN